MWGVSEVNATKSKRLLRAFFLKEASPMTDIFKNCAKTMLKMIRFKFEERYTLKSTEVREGAFSLRSE